MSGQRYKAEEIKGFWFVYDTKYPEREPYAEDSEEEARLTARIWNLLASPEVWR